MVNRLVIFFVVISVISSACRTSKIPPIQPPPEVRIENKSTQSLLELMTRNELQYEWLSAKFSCEAQIDDKSNSFTVNIREKRDSVIWMSISSFGIEAARVIVTKDSVKLRNNLSKTYFIGDFNYLSKMLNTDVDYEMLQSLLVGNSVEYYEEDEKLRSSRDNGRYVLSTIKRRKLKKVLERNEQLKNEVAQIIWLEPNTYKISKISIQDYNTNRSFEAGYSNYQQVDSLLVPYDAKFNVKAEKSISISISYSKITLNNPQTFPFNIPDNYDKKQ